MPLTFDAPVVHDRRHPITPRSESSYLKEADVVAVVVVGGCRPDLAGRYDRQMIQSQKYFYKKPSRDEGIGKYLLWNPGGGGYKIGSKLSLSHGGLARCGAGSLIDAAKADWLVKSLNGTMRVDRSLTIQLLGAQQACLMTMSLKQMAPREEDLDLTTRAVREVFNTLGPDRHDCVFLADVIANDKLLRSGRTVVKKSDRQVLELLEALGHDTFDFHDFERAYLQCNDRFEIRVGHLVSSFGKFCGNDATHGMKIEDAHRFAKQVFPHAEDIRWDRISSSKKKKRHYQSRRVHGDCGRPCGLACLCLLKGSRSLLSQGGDPSISSECAYR